MAGNTSRIDAAILRVQWASYLPMAAICSHWTISKDQLIRLRNVWQLPLRLDRKRRYKPSRAERMLDPDEAELRASESSLSLAPMVAARVTCVQASWTEAQWADRQATPPTPFTLHSVEIPDELRQVESEDS